MPTFAKYDRISRYPPLISSEKTEATTREMAHNEYPVHSINASGHKPGISVDVFEIVLISSAPR